MLKCEHAQGRIIEWLKKVKKEAVFSVLFSSELETLKENGKEIVTSIARALNKNSSPIKKLVLFGSGKKCEHPKGDDGLTYCVTCTKLFDCDACLKAHQLAFTRHTFFLFICNSKDSDDDEERYYECLECKVKEQIHLSDRFNLATRIIFMLCNPKLARKDSESNITASFSQSLEPSSTRPAGLINMGNTCFFNSSLQSLAALEHLSNYTYDSNSPFVSALRDTLALINSSSKAFKPSKVFSLLSSKYKQYKSFRQEDAHEVLARMLDIFDSQSKSSSGPSVVDHLFTGKLLSVVECLRCKHVSRPRIIWKFL